MSDRTKTRYPGRKISETILDFAAPLLETAEGKPPPEETFENIVQLMPLYLTQSTAMTIK